MLTTATHRAALEQSRSWSVREVWVCTQTSGVSVNLLEVSSNEVPPMAHGQAFCRSCETVSRSPVPQMPFDICFFLFLKILPLTSHGSLTSTLVSVGEE